MPSSPSTWTDQGLGIDVDHVGAEHLDHVEHLAPIEVAGGHLDQRQFAIDHRRIGDVLNRDYVNQLEQLAADLIDLVVVTVDDDRHPAQARLFAVSDGERFNVETTTAEQRRDARQDAGPVFDVGDAWCFEKPCSESPLLALEILSRFNGFR